MYDDGYLDVIRKRKLYLEKLIEKKTEALAKAPEGKLRFSQRGKQVYYYRRTDPKDFSGVYLRRADMKIAAALAQKDYDQKVLLAAQRELRQLEQIMKYMPIDKLEHLYDRFPIPRKVLITPAAVSDKTYAELWQNTVYETKGFSDDAPLFLTGKNERVRSKSEILIADALARYNVPYRYECPIKTRQLGTLYPDFTALKTSTRTVFIWEHFGMMDDPDYVERALYRIDVLEANGYLPGKNLIITHETSTSPIKMKVVNQLIEEFLL